MAEVAAQTVKKVALELGGKSANVVFADADLEKAAATAPYGVFDNAGQDKGLTTENGVSFINPGSPTVPEAQARGYQQGRFSFNVKGGRCENCAGDGTIKIEMHFLPDIFVHCDVCKGQRYNRETLEIRYRGKTIHDVLDMTVDERARAGLFLAMQYPVDVPGVSVSNFLRTAVTAVRGEAPKLREWIKEMRGAMTDLQIDQAFAERSVNEGFSGGERKRHEILQMELLKPKMAVLDETDSGLDVDALKVVSDGVNRVRETGSTGVLLITHYTRILRYIRPDFVHVFVDGSIAEEGGPELADRLEDEGYDRYLQGAS